MSQKATFETARIPAEALVDPGNGPAGELQRLDRYELKKQLNKGGFATVYEAYDPRIKRSVAVKKCSSLDEENHERFFREAEIAGNLSHPNIVRIFDFGVADGIPFIVQELLGGKDLTDWIESGLELSTYDRVRILLQVSDGLAYAHSRDVIHRDVKPGNVRVLEDGSIKLLDFGVAAIQEAPSDLTQAGTTVGTAAYLAPEQIRGERPGRATDLFSFGVMAYELLSGHRPFEGETLSAVLYQIAHQQPEELRAGAIPNRLVRLVHRCLAKDARQRPDGFDEVVAELEEVLRDPRLAPPSADTVPIQTHPQAPPSAFRPAAARAHRQPSRPLPTRPRVPRFSEQPLDGPRPPLRNSSARIQVARRRRRKGKALATLALLLVAGATFVVLGGPLPEPVSGVVGRAADLLPPEVRDWVDSIGPTRTTANRGPAAPGALAGNPAEAEVAGTTSQQKLGTDSMPTEAADPDEAVTQPASEATSGPAPDPVSAAVAALEARRQPRRGDAPAPGRTARRSSSSAPATVFLPPSWHPQMMVSIDGGAFQALDRRRMQELRPGTHQLTFWLNTLSYQARRTLDFEFEPGETRTVESPLAPPAALRIALEPETLAARVEIDGRTVKLPLDGLEVLEPGNHRLTLYASPADPLGPLTKMVELHAATVHQVTFDMRRRRALLETREAYKWDG